MDPRLFRLRRGIIHLILQGALLALCVRMAVVQCLRQPYYASLAEGMERATVSLEPRRGSILDRNRRSLAVSVQAPSVFINPRAVPAGERDGVARRLAETVRADREILRRRLDSNLYFAWVRRRVTEEEAEAVRALGIPGVGFREESRRRYPHDTFLCHLLGFVGTDERGLAGLEAQYDRLLGGEAGREEVLLDGRGRRIGAPEGPIRPVRHGSSLVLTIDSAVQSIVEEELAAIKEEHNPVSASAVVMDPWTGDVLAMANLPTFHPARFSEADAGSWKNMAVSDCVEPGSSFKPFIVAAALAYGVVTPETIFDCHQGSFRIGRRTLHDAHPLGRLTVRDVVAYSSNIGMAQIGARLTPEQIHHALSAFGFGRPTGIGLAGESAGILRPTAQWTGLSVASISMGQEVSVSALQLTAAYCVFANGGWYVQPRLVLGIADTDGARMIEAAGAPRYAKVLDERIAKLMCDDFLVGVVDRGTARRAAVAGYRLAGKTGTAQIARAEGGGYEPGAYNATFVCIAPADAPRYVIGLIVRRPRGKAYYGGVVAAPPAARIAERLLAAGRIPRVAPPPAATLASIQTTRRTDRR